MDFKTIVLASLLTAQAALAADTWGWTSAKNLCAGIITDCSDKDTCTSVGVGPCEGDTVVKPTAYLKSSLVGLAFVVGDKYLACTDPGSCTDMKVLGSTGVGYRDHKAGKNAGADDTEYAYTMSGNVFGNLDTAGGYAGVASYLNTGSKAISTKTNNVYIATKDATAQKDRSAETDSDSDSKIGAPVGPYKVCITSHTGGACDGADRTFEPSEYKFSIFGYMTGDDYPPTAGQGGFPADYDHLGFRMKLSAVGFKISDIKINGRAYDKKRIGDDVTKLELMHGDGGIKIEFPKKYNRGPTAGADATGDKVMTVSETKDVKIHVHGANEAEQFVWIDYLFETAGQTKGMYFMYDPDVSEVAAPASAEPEPTPSAPGSGSDLGTDSGASLTTICSSFASAALAAAVMRLA
jgi:hypothetical protein